MKVPPPLPQRQQSLWDENGIPLNKAAALADCVEWLELMDRIFVGRSKSKISIDVSTRINACIAECKKHYKL